MWCKGRNLSTFHFVVRKKLARVQHCFSWHRSVQEVGYSYRRKVVSQSTNNGRPPPTKICKPNQDTLLFKTPEVPRTSPTTSERTPLSENLTETPVHSYPTTSKDLIPISEEPKEKVRVTLESLSSLLRSTPDMCLFVDLSEWRDCTLEKKSPAAAIPYCIESLP